MTTLTHTYNRSINGDGSFALPLNLFDSNTGTLQSVIVVEALTADFAANPASGFWNGYVTTGSTTTKVLDPQTLTRLSATGGPSSLDGSPVLTIIADGNATTYTKTTPVPFTISATTGPVTIPTPIIAQFEAPGGGISSLNISIVTTPFGDASIGGQLTLTWPTNSPTLDFSLQLTYTYIPSAVVAITPGRILDIPSNSYQLRILPDIRIMPETE